MTGRHIVKIRSKRVQFILELERNITVIRGDSATGKTTLIGLLRDYDTLGEQSGVSVECDKPCHVISSVDWESRLHSMSNCIVFADEGNSFVNSKEFAESIRGTNNYYVLVTRESLYQLPYSVDAVLELKKTTSRFKRTYNRAYPYYKSLDKAQEKFENVDQVLTEDSNSGYQMFTHIARLHGTECISALGKSNIFKILSDKTNELTLVVADGAAFGADMEKLYQFQKLHPKCITLYLPESFEWLLLKAGVIYNSDLEEILNNPYNYIDSTQHFSWEQYFTDLLIELTSEYPHMKYSKHRLLPFYLKQENIQKVLEAIEANNEK